MNFSSQNLRELNPWADPWWSHIVSAAADEIERLRAENARLREALTMFTMFYPFGISLELDQAFRTARAALAEKDEK